MKATHTILAAIGALALAATGCVGSLESSGPGGGDPNPGNPDAGPSNGGGADAGPTGNPGTAQALFEQNVRPIVNAACGAAGGCHNATSPAFITADPAQSYSLIQTYRDVLFPGYAATGSRLLVNGEGAHQGAQYSATDVQAIEAWLAQELADSQGGGGGGNQASPLAIWSGCMDLNDWQQEEVSPLWANKNAQGQGNCEACHNLGADGFMASDQYQRVFDTITQSPSFMLSYFTLNDSGTQVIINRARLENVGNQLPPHEAHGAFQVDGNAMDALIRFYDKTAARLAAGQCGPPRFPQP